MHEKRTELTRVMVANTDLSPQQEQAEPPPVTESEAELLPVMESRLTTLILWLAAILVVSATTADFVFGRPKTAASDSTELGEVLGADAQDEWNEIRITSALVGLLYASEEYESSAVQCFFNNFDDLAQYIESTIPGALSTAVQTNFLSRVRSQFPLWDICYGEKSAGSEDSSFSSLETVGHRDVHAVEEMLRSVFVRLFDILERGGAVDYRPALNVDLWRIEEKDREAIGKRAAFGEDGRGVRWALWKRKTSQAPWKMGQGSDYIFAFRGAKTWDDAAVSSDLLLDASGVKEASALHSWLGIHSLGEFFSDGQTGMNKAPWRDLGSVLRSLKAHLRQTRSHSSVILTGHSFGGWFCGVARHLLQTGQDRIPAQNMRMITFGALPLNLRAVSNETPVRKVEVYFRDDFAQFLGQWTRSESELPAVVWHITPVGDAPWVMPRTRVSSQGREIASFLQATRYSGWPAFAEATIESDDRRKSLLNKIGRLRQQQARRVHKVKAKAAHMTGVAAGAATSDEVLRSEAGKDVSTWRVFPRFMAALRHCLVQPRYSTFGWCFQPIRDHRVQTSYDEIWQSEWGHREGEVVNNERERISGLIV